MKSIWLNISTIALCFNLLSCATSSTINGPDGTPHQLIECVDIKLCYEKATELCGGKYKIVNTSNEVSGHGQNTSSTTNLLVKCQ